MTNGTDRNSNPNMSRASRLKAAMAGFDDEDDDDDDFFGSGDATDNNSVMEVDDMEFGDASESQGSDDTMSTDNGTNEFLFIHTRGYNKCNILHCKVILKYSYTLSIFCDNKRRLFKCFTIIYVLQMNKINNFSSSKAPIE